MKLGLLVEINNIVDILRKCALSAEDNNAQIIGDDVVWAGYENITEVLKDRPYSEIYKQCVNSKAYTIMMIDGGILQFMYRVHSNHIFEHRLAFLPNPFAKNFGLSEDSFDEEFENFEVLPQELNLHAQSPMISPVRFDFSNEDKKHVIVKHPRSHMTIGGYMNCRIPVAGPVSPTEFVVFILRNFYHSKFNSDLEAKLTLKKPYQNNIHIDEQSILHLNRLLFRAPRVQNEQVVSRRRSRRRRRT